MTRWLPALTLLVGCNILGGSGSSGNTQTGELGNGEFSYHCTDCIDLTAGFPGAIAVGGRFEVRFGIGSDSFPVQTASQVLVAETGNVFEGQRPGTFSLLARSGDRIVDMIHLDFQEVTTLRLENDGTELDEDVSVEIGGEVVELAAVPYGNMPLSGELDYEWTVEDEDILDLEGSSRRVNLEPLQPGITRVTVSTLGFTRELTVYIGGSSPPTRVSASGPDPETDSSGETDGDTEGATDESTGTGGDTGGTGTTGGTN